MFDEAGFGGDLGVGGGAQPGIDIPGGHPPAAQHVGGRVVVQRGGVRGGVKGDGGEDMPGDGNGGFGDGGEGLGVPDEGADGLAAVPGGVVGQHRLVLAGGVYAVAVAGDVGGSEQAHQAGVGGKQGAHVADGEACVRGGGCGWRAA